VKKLIKDISRPQAAAISTGTSTVQKEWLIFPRIFGEEYF